MIIFHCKKQGISIYYTEEVKFLSAITLDGKRFIEHPTSKLMNGFIGFFDWLRTQNNEIKGVSFWFFENASIKEILFENDDIVKKGDHFIFYFSKDRENLFNNGDQDFSGNHVYFYQDELLFTFNTDFLEEQEIKSLMMFCKKQNDL